jgi:hypothetical protein
MTLTDEAFIHKARDLGTKCNVPDEFKFSVGWLASWKKYMMCIQYCVMVKQLIPMKRVCSLQGPMYGWSASGVHQRTFGITMSQVRFGGKCLDAPS